MTSAGIPVIGEMVMRLRNFSIMKGVLLGGVVHPKSIPPVLLKEMYEVGNRPGHYRAFISLRRHATSWGGVHLGIRNYHRAGASYPGRRGLG